MSEIAYQIASSQRADVTGLPDFCGHWWACLPGTGQRVEGWENEATPNALCAMACVAHMCQRIEKTRLRRTLEQQGVLQKWLNEAKDPAAAWLRRLALCYLTEIVPPGTEARDLPGYAEWLLDL